MSDKIVKQHDPNCSFLKVDIETDPTMRSSYGCDCGLHSVADEVTMGDAWMSGPEDFTKGIEEQINKYREMFPDSPIHILGTVIPPLNQKEDLYPISKSVLYRSFDKSIGVPSQEFNAFLPAGPKPKPSKEKLERLSEKINSAQPFSESKLHETFDGPEITEGAEPEVFGTLDKWECKSLIEDKIPEGNPLVAEWLKTVSEFEYETCTRIQKANPVFRALGTSGKWMISLVLKSVSEPSESQEETYNCADCNAPLIKKKNATVLDPPTLLCHSCWTETWAILFQMIREGKYDQCKEKFILTRRK